MARTYSEFKTYLKTFLWKPNDQVLSSNLDSLIQMADAELNRRLKIMDREETVRLSPDSEEVVLPTDFHAIRGVSSPSLVGSDGGDWGARTPSRLKALRATNNSSVFMPTYAIRHHTLLLVGPYSATSSIDVDVEYWTKIPDYETDDASWLEEDYLDLYTYAVLKQSAMFLREDERIQTWIMLFNEALESCMEDDAHNRATAVMDSAPATRQSSTYSRRSR